MAWIIDIDHEADQTAKAGTNLNAVGVSGRVGKNDKPAEFTCKFRMLDDDRNVYYEGRADRNGTFDPLDDFGEPNFGCTIIQYLINGIWQDL